jgi:hypothetical protein
MSFTVNNDMTIQVADPKIVHEKYITLKRGDLEYHIKATFDLKDVPPEFHQMALSLIKSGGTTLLLPIK